MTYCQNCGSPVEGRFCAKCGAASGQDAGSPGYQASPPGRSGASTMTDNVASAFCYVPVLGGLVFLLMEPYNRNKLIRFHAFQALLLAAAMFVLNMLLTSFIHLLFAFYGIFSLLQWTYFIASAYVAYKAYTGEKVVLPVIGPFAEKQA